MSVGSNLALAAPLGLQLPGFANAPSPQTGLLQQALRPKKGPGTTLVYPSVVRGHVRRRNFMSFRARQVHRFHQDPI